MPVLAAGVIVIWRNSIASIPTGWIICDGSLGTPDLRDRFIEGAGGALSPDDTGGSDTHDHNFTGDGHSHTLLSSGPVNSGAIFDDNTNTVAVTGTTDSASSNPSFYALAYIQKT